MKLYGISDEWLDLIETLVPDILELVVSTWRMMPPLVCDAREDPTTEELSRRLRNNRSAAELPLRIDIQMVELGESADEDQGRMDIVFSPLVPTEQVYFCLECKRLNVKKGDVVRTYASEYVAHGMLRFVKSKYAPVVGEGGMLGYVLDGKTDAAMESVSSVVRKRYEELRMERPGTMHRSSVRRADDLARETRHKRRRDRQGFLIHHIFAPVTTA